MTHNGRFSKTQQALLEVLSDGRRHTAEEIANRLDEIGQVNVKALVFKTRQKLLPAGEDIVSVYYYRRCYYQHIRLLTNPYDGSM